MITYPEQSLQVAEPLAVYCNNSCVLLDDNRLQQSAKGGKLFSSFKIFKLKGPIDVNFLIDVIFPPEDKRHFEIEESEYDGESVKVRFNFSNKTHTDLIEYLKRASRNLFQISGNGLRDWVPADKVTSKLVYGNSFEQLSSFTTDHSDNNEEYPEIDEESLFAELEKLVEKTKSQRGGLSREILNDLFYCAFKRRDMSVNLHDIKNEFFSQLNIAQFLPSSKSFDLNDIGDKPLGLNQIKNVVCNLLISYLQRYVNNGIQKIVKDHKFLVAIVLWNLINTIRAIHKSYQVLKDNDSRFKKVLQDKKLDFIRYLNNMEFWLGEMLKILEKDLDESQYEKFQKRLVNFLTAAEGLLETIKITALEYDTAIKVLEDQEKGLSTGWWLSAALLGGAAVLGAGYFAYKCYNNKEINGKEKLIATGVGVVGTATLVTGHFAIEDLQKTIIRQTSMLEQLKNVHEKILHWTRCGRDLQNWEQTKMNQYRNTLSPQLNQIKLQCKEFEKNFEDQE